MQKPSLIITGATGLVGSRFVELYADQFVIHNLDLTTGVDITQADQVKAFIASHPAQALVHLAAFTDTARAEAESGDKSGLCYRVNVEGTKHLAASAQLHNLYFVHVSTDFVFDGTKSEPYVENDPPSPLGWYGTTKAMAEEVVVRSGAKYSLARLSYPYRANYALKPDLIQKIRHNLANQTLPPQFTDTTITPTFVDDIAAGLAAIITTAPTGTYHLVGSTSLSPYTLARLVAETYGFDPDLVKPGNLSAYLKTNPRPFARHGSISNQLTSERLGIKFKTIQEGLAALLSQQAL